MRKYKIGDSVKIKNGGNAVITHFKDGYIFMTDSNGKIFKTKCNDDIPSRNTSQNKYVVKKDLIFNLESMQTLLENLEYDYEIGNVENGEILGYSYDEIYELIDECTKLEIAAKSRKVTSEEYGRIKEIAEYRKNHRYEENLKAGLSEEEASALL